MVSFQLCYNLLQTHTRSELLLGPHPVSWAVANNEPPVRTLFEVLSICFNWDCMS
jgi:hypothetical protein